MLKPSRTDSAGDRKPPARATLHEPSPSDNGVLVQPQESSSDNTDPLPIENLLPPIRVVGDFFAIDKVVGWRGEGPKRRYKVRWCGLPPDRDDWMRPSDLCISTLSEAHALVRRDRAQQKARALGLKVPPSPTVSMNEAEKKGQRGKSPKKKPAKLKKPPAKLKKAPPKQKQSAPKKTTGTWHHGSKVLLVEATGIALKEYGEHPIALCVDSSDDDVQLIENPVQSTGGRKRDRKPKSSKTPRGRRKKRNKKAESEDDESDDNMTPAERAKREISKGNDADLVGFQPVERIDVHAEGAGKRVREARIYGIPIVLTGHHSWPQFAARWLKGVDADQPLRATNANELDIESMIRDIGDEDVPVVQKNYNERNPTENSIRASAFLREFWPKDGEPTIRRRNLYLQQWQFPHSKRASKILCGPNQCSALPNDIFEEDLLPFWLNQGGNPYQYLFMGDTGTMSKLHKDPGGLEILIAPIVGEKECILVHRQDGERYLYNLNSKLEKVDLNRFPRTAFARVWQTVVIPGEILVMPYDTYHQCRNITPCLSYHRLHLDVVNLRGFLESMNAGDAKELDHSEVIWNSCDELINRVSEFVSEYRATKEATENVAGVIGNKEAETVDEGSITMTVDTLRLFRPVCLDILRQFYAPNKATKITPKYNPDDWGKIVQEIDRTLHEYRHRDSKVVPRFRPQTIHALRGTLVNKSPDRDSDSADSADEDEKTEYTGKWTLEGKFQALESAIDALPPLSPDQEDVVIPDSVSIQVGDRVSVRLALNRLGKGRIECIKGQMKAVFVTYDGLPAVFDEFHPVANVRGRIESEKFATRVQTPLKTTLGALQGEQQLVRCLPSGGDGKYRPASILSTMTASFYRVRLQVQDRTICRWMRKDDFISKEAR